jgi:UDP-N-acetyl-D-mannosaminuronate dehydrogenase
MLKNLGEEAKYNAIIIAVAHDIFKKDGTGITLEKLRKVMNGRPVLVDIRRFFDKVKAIKAGFLYRTL